MSLPSAPPLSPWRGRLGRGLQFLFVLVPLAVAAFFAGRYLWAEHHVRAAGDALGRHDFVQALNHLDRSLQVRPNDFDTRLLAARSARRAGRLEDAERHLAECDRLRPLTQPVRLEGVLLQAQRGDPDANLDALLGTFVNQGHPDRELILEALAQRYLSSYQLPRAGECLDLLLQGRPEHVPALLLRAEVRQGLQQHDEALADYHRILRLDPNQDTARLQLALYLAYSNQADEAVEHLEHLRHRLPNDPRVLLALARCRREANRPDEARQLLDALLAEYPRHFAALRDRARLDLDAGRPAAAEPRLWQAVELDPYDQEAVYQYYLCLQALGRQEEAKAWAERLRRIDADLERLADLNHRIAKAPRDPAPRCEAGLICLRNGQDQEGLRWLTGALQQAPAHKPSHQALAEYYERTDNREQAERHRRLAGSESPVSRH